MKQRIKRITAIGFVILIVACQACHGQAKAPIDEIITDKKYSRGKGRRILCLC